MKPEKLYLFIGLSLKQNNWEIAHVCPHWQAAWWRSIQEETSVNQYVQENIFLSVVQDMSIYHALIIY